MTVTQNSGATLDETYSRQESGIKILTKVACKLYSVTKDSDSNTTKAHLKAAAFGGADIAAASFVGNVATFSPAPDLADATNYYIMGDTGATNVACDSDTMPAYPIVLSHTNIVCSAWDGSANPWIGYAQFPQYELDVSADITVTPSALALSTICCWQILNPGNEAS